MKIARVVLPTLLAAQLWAGTRIPLTGEWQFRIDSDRNGESLGWSARMPEGTGSVVVPHTWNIGKYADQEGTAWYFREFPAPDNVRGRHVELQFDATFYKSRVWLNGVLLGAHEGGHTAYHFDVTPHLKARNFVAVELNNEPGLATIPGWAMKLKDGKNIWYDWWHYGGIVRDVSLVVSDPALIRRQQIRTRLDGANAEITARVFVENFGAPRDLKLRVQAYAPGISTPAATAEVPLRAAAGGSEANLSFRLDRPALWHFDHPNVYRIETELLAGDAAVDALVESFGVRRIEFRDRKLYLNGEPVRLTGMTRHEESPWEGLAETRGTMKHDYDEMKELQVTLTRPVHYPQHPYILEYCDRKGILLIPEIPMWQFSEAQMSDPRVIQLAQRMMTEMIEQAYNHPSILGWSVCNESATHTPGGRAYFEALYATVKKLDPDRYVTYADDQISAGADPKINSASVADFIMMNQYFGTWHGAAENLVPALDRVGREYPDKTVIISEFGAAGTFGPDKATSDRLRARIIEEQLDVFGKYDFIAGAVFWCYQDYKSHRNLRPGMTAGQVEMGIVDENRQRYPSYAVWQRRNAPALVELRWKREGVAAPSGFRVGIRPRPADQLPHYTMDGYRAAWELRADDGTLLASGTKDLAGMGPEQSFEAAPSFKPARGMQLTFRLIRPTGFTAAEQTLDWWEGLSGGYTTDDFEKEGRKIQ